MQQIQALMTVCILRRHTKSSSLQQCCSLQHKLATPANAPNRRCARLELLLQRSQGCWQEPLPSRTLRRVDAA